MPRRTPLWIADRSIAGKLTLIALATSGIAMALVTLLISGASYFYYRSDLLVRLDAQARIIAENSAAAVVFQDARNAREILSALRLTPEIDEGVVRMMDGTVLARYRRDAGAGAPLGPIPRYETHRIGLSHAEVAYPVLVNSERRGVVQIRASLSDLYSRVLAQLAMVWIVALVALLAAFALLARLRRLITVPLARLVAVIEEVSRDRDYRKRAPVEGRDETSLLARRFNEMLAVVERHQHELDHELGVRRRTEEQLHRLANFDAVTSLPNRHYFNEYLRNAVARTLRGHYSIGLMFVDIDHFKVINDTLGHDAGDHLLGEVARRLTGALRPADTVCRFGGDEYAIVFDDLSDRDEARRVAERVISAIRAPIHVDDRDIYLTASAGISLCPEDAAEMQSLLRQADTAMYHAKEGGRDTYRFFTDDMRLRAQRRLSIEQSLRRALEREEFLLHYQPVIDPSSSRVVAVEALLRWRHPELGVVVPDEFIPTAEETGLIIPIGEWALRRACAEARGWSSQGRPVGIAVNVSGRQLRESDLFGTVRAVLTDNALEAGRLTLEVTELALVDGSHTTRERLQLIDLLGVHVAIDDFGSGYSSMGYLRRLPVHTLKVDRSLVHGVPGDRDGEAIIEAIVAMCRSLDLGVTVEGIETPEQAQYLQRYAPIALQGFFFSRPLPADELEALLGGAGDEAPRPGGAAPPESAS